MTRRLVVDGAVYTYVVGRQYVHVRDPDGRGQVVHKVYCGDAVGGDWTRDGSRYVVTPGSLASFVRRRGRHRRAMH